MDFNDRILSIEDRIPFMLTKRKLEESKHNFKVDQKIKNSDIITFNSIPSSLRINEEDISADFSIFGHNWENIQNVNITCIDVSEDGKYCISAGSEGGLYLSLDFGNSWVILIDDTVTSSIIYDSVTISSDGSILIASSINQTVISKDFSNTWSIIDINNAYSLRISCDNKIILISNSNGMNISEDTGLTWNIIQKDINSFSSSSNCQYLSFFYRNRMSLIYYSNDHGKNIAISNSPRKIWISLSISSTGQYQTAISKDNLIYISSDYGVNWISSNSILDETLINVAISGSGKYQLISGTNVYVSKDYGVTWRTYFSNDPYIIDYICLSYNGRIGIMISNGSIFKSSIITKYIKESGTVSFSPLDQSFFASTFNIETDFTDLCEQISNNKTKIVSSRYGKYKSICVENGNIWRSDDYGVTYNITNPTDIKNWSSITVSSSGKYQIATIKEGELWRSDDYGLNFFKVESSSIGGFDIYDVAISENGKYQTMCGGGNIAYSLDFGYTWISTNICSDNLISITVSKNGKYQSVCGSNSGDSNSVMYSKNYGCSWRYSNLNNSGIQWKSISCSSCGQYQTLCSSNLDNNSDEIEINIMISEDYGVNWSNSLSGSKNWSLVYVTYNGQKQLACENNGDIYLSLDFGYTWNSCYSNTNNWKSIAVTDTLQFIDVLYSGSLLTSKIEGDIPGFITISSQSAVNNNATILLSGNNSNIYSYETDHIKSFNIISSDFEDSGQVSYLILDYGQQFD